MKTAEPVSGPTVRLSPGPSHCQHSSWLQPGAFLPTPQHLPVAPDLSVPVPLSAPAHRGSPGMALTQRYVRRTRFCSRLPNPYLKDVLRWQWGAWDRRFGRLAASAQPGALFCRTRSGSRETPPPNFQRKPYFELGFGKREQNLVLRTYRWVKAMPGDPRWAGADRGTGTGKSGAAGRESRYGLKSPKQEPIV